MKISSLPVLIGWCLAAPALFAAAGCGADEVAPPGDTPDAGALPDAPPPPPPPEPSLRIFEHGIAVDLTPDGLTAVLEDISTLSAGLVFVDTLTGEARQVATIGDATRNLATGVSATGHVTALHGEPVKPGVWSAADGWRDLESAFAEGCDSELGGAWDISADGHVVVGFSWNRCSPQAFRWSDADGTGDLALLDLLGAAPDGATRTPSNRPTVVSDDGRVAAGFAETGIVDRAPAYWDASGHGVMLEVPANDAPGEVLSISADGSVLAGIWANDAFRWTVASGMVLLPRLDTLLPSDPVFANAMTADGRVVLGAAGSSFFGVPTAFVWSAAGGMRPLAPIVLAAGLTIPADVWLTNVMAASDDGTVLVGNIMTERGAQKTFVLRLPPHALD